MQASSVGLRVAVKIVICVSFQAVVSAGPISMLDVIRPSDSEPPPAHELDADDWLILHTRDDHGWHLGWFKRTAPRDEGLPNDVLEPYLPVTWQPLIVPTGPLVNTIPPGEFPWAASDLLGQSTSSASTAVVPEPATMVLFVSGLAMIGRRVHSARNPRR
jgi:hypothetical protein